MPRSLTATPREREYLVAVAELLAAGGPVTGGAVARQLHVAPAQLSSYRARLLTKGTLTAEGDQLRFPVPGMGAYVLKTHDQQSGPVPVMRGRRKHPPQAER